MKTTKGSWKRLLVAMGVALFAQVTGHSVSASDCPAPADGQVRLLKEIGDIVAADDFAAARNLTERVWSADEAHARGVAPALEAVGAWMAHSLRLKEIEYCIDDEGRPTGHFLNERTGMVDLVRISVDQAEAGRITGIAVRTAVRAGETVVSPGTESEALAMLSDYVQGLASDGMFSGTVLLARGGEPLYFESFGFSDPAAGIPLKNDSSYNLASLNKIFTAVAVLQLVEREKLRLDSPLVDLLPDSDKSEGARQIQIRHLLSHTSGAMSSLETLAFPPGTDYAYSNYGFGLLGQVIEAVSHTSYDDYLRLHILGPVGMARTASYQLVDSDEMIPGLVWGYEPDLEQDTLTFVPNPWLQKFPGSPVGGYYSTAEDLLKFASALMAGKLIGNDFVQMMRTPKPELGAEEYGFGTMLWRGPGIWGHGGDLPGADADLEIYGDTGYVAIVLGNFVENNPPVLMKIRSLFFPESVPK